MAPAFPMLWQARARRDAMMISVGVQVLLAAVLMAVAITFCIESFQQDFSLAVDGITQSLTRSFAVLLTAASSIGLSISSIRQWLRTPVSESAKIVDDAASGAIRQKLGFMHIIKKELDRLGKVLQGERPVPNFLDYLLPTALLNGHTHSLLLWLLGLSQHGQDFQPCRMVIYVDDLDIGEVLTREEVQTLRGTQSPALQLIKKAYLNWGLPGSEDKECWRRQDFNTRRKQMGMLLAR